MADRRAPALLRLWCFGLTLLLPAPGHVTGLEAVNPAHMKLERFEPAPNSNLPDSMLLKELNATSECACRHACLAMPDCLSASVTELDTTGLPAPGVRYDGDVELDAIVGDRFLCLTFALRRLLTCCLSCFASYS